MSTGKIFDLHIGLSDSAILKEDLGKEGKEFPFPTQFTFSEASLGGLDMFVGMACPIIMEDSGRFVLPKDPKAEVLRHINFYKSLEEKGLIKIIRSKKDMNTPILKVIMGIEGIYFVENEDDLKFLESLFDMGVKVIGPVWYFKSTFLDSNVVRKKFFKLCFDRNIVIDLAHSESTVFDIIYDCYNGPVIDSHSGLYDVSPNERNISSEKISKIIKKGGLIGMPFLGEFIGGSKINNVFDHLDRFKKLYGVSNLAIGSDFEGMGYQDIIENLGTVKEYPNLRKFLLGKGFSQEECHSILFKNASEYFCRVY